jgi:hypothetical protein
MELLAAFWEILKDPSKPEHRIARKTTTECFLVRIVWLLYARPDTPQRLLVWIAGGLVVGLGAALFGSLCAGSFYTSFLRGAGAQKTQSATFVVFLAEWIIAIVVPLTVFFVSLLLWVVGPRLTAGPHSLQSLFASLAMRTW